MESLENHTFLFAERELANNITKGQRLDHRKIDELRLINFESDCLQNTHGSVKLTMGKSVVYAGVRVKILPLKAMNTSQNFVTNKEKTPQGVLVCNVELSSLSVNHIENFSKIGIGPPNGRCQATAAWLQQTLNSCIDFDKLLISKNNDEDDDDDDDKNFNKELEKKNAIAAYCIEVDVVCIHVDGSLWDACLLAAVAALKKCSWPAISAENVESKLASLNEENSVSRALKKTTDKRKIPFIFLPISLTSVSFPTDSHHRLMNPTNLEERISSGLLTCVYQFLLNKDEQIDSPGHLLSIHKIGGSSISSEDLNKFIKLKSTLVTFWLQFLT